jgi:hypothetical protein
LELRGGFGWELGTIFDTTSSMRREGVVGIHALLNAVQSSDLSAFLSVGLSLIADAICQGHDARAGGVATRIQIP